MSAPFNDLSTKTEAALKSLVDAILLANRGSAPCFIGLDGDELPLPRIEVSAKQGNEDEPGIGNYWMDCEVRIYSSANADVDAHNSRSAYVMDTFNSDSLEESLSSATSDFSCFGIIERKHSPRRKEERHYITEFGFKALCCGSDQ